MVIGSRVKEARIKKGYNQQCLADLLGVSKVSVCHYENGERTPKMKVFLDMIKVLDVDPNYLLGREVNVISETENDRGLRVRLAKEDLQILREIKTDKVLYNKLFTEPKRTVELIIRLMNK